MASPRASENGKLALVFSDNRNGTHDSANPVTNTDVFLTTSTDGGRTWSALTQVDSSPTDQWFPWVDINPTNGTIGVLYNDREVADPTLYDVALTEFPGSKTIVSTAPSHPTQSRFFRAGVPGCENCAVFHGDYIDLAYGTDGHANLVWTDMRDPAGHPGPVLAVHLLRAEVSGSRGRARARPSPCAPGCPHRCGTDLIPVPSAREDVVEAGEVEVDRVLVRKRIVLRPRVAPRGLHRRSPQLRSLPLRFD